MAQILPAAVVKYTAPKVPTAGELYMAGKPELGGALALYDHTREPLLIWMAYIMPSKSPMNASPESEGGAQVVEDSGNTTTFRFTGGGDGNKVGEG